jgi:hypothetical protein
MTEIMSDYVEASPADPDAPGAFRFAEPGRLAAILTDAGAIGVSERVLKFHIAAPISVEEFWVLRSETSDTVRERLAKLNRQQIVRVASEVQEAVREFFPNNRMSFPCANDHCDWKTSKSSILRDNYSTAA